MLLGQAACREERWRSLRRRMIRPILSRLARRRGSEPLSEETVLEALRRLDAAVPAFSHLSFDHRDLHGALEAFLGKEIRLERLSTHVSPVVARWLRRTTVRAELICVPEADFLTLLLPTNLHPADERDAHLHELAHLLAAHPMPCRSKAGQDRAVSFWTPPRTLIRRKPPFDVEACAMDPELRRRMVSWCEDDADRWVEHLRTISALGRNVYLREERVLGL